MANCILCDKKPEWKVNVIHDGKYTTEPMCDKCYRAFNYGFRQALFQNIDRFPDLKVEGQSKQEVEE